MKLPAQPQLSQPQLDRARLIGAFIEGVNSRIGAEWREHCIRLHGPHWREEWKQARS